MEYDARVFDPNDSFPLQCDADVLTLNPDTWRELTEVQRVVLSGRSTGTSGLTAVHELRRRIAEYIAVRSLEGEASARVALNRRFGIACSRLATTTNLELTALTAAGLISLLEGRPRAEYVSTAVRTWVALQDGMRPEYQSPFFGVLKSALYPPAPQRTRRRRRGL